MVVHEKKHIAEWLFDGFCIASLAGIWPRFIEPGLLMNKKITIPLKRLPDPFLGMKILHFSDLHFNSKMTKNFLNKILSLIMASKPDLIAFTGDFLSFSRLEEGLLEFLQKIPKAPLGNFAVLGNHDYEKYVSISENGSYIIEKAEKKIPPILKGLKRIFSPVKPKGVWEEGLSSVKIHPELYETLKKSPFRLLHNETVQIKKNGRELNISGFGEYMMKKIDVEKAKLHLKSHLPTVALLHNPDGIKRLLGFPVDLFLSGHTHGGQVNLPFIRDNFIVLENKKFCKGIVQEKSSLVHISKGVGSGFNFRFFCPPEMTLITLAKG